MVKTKVDKVAANKLELDFVINTDMRVSTWCLLTGDWSDMT